VNVGVVPWKFPIKILNQNFCKKGDVIIVKETINKLINRPEALALLKKAKSKPKPITVNIELSMKRLPYIV